MLKILFYRGAESFRRARRSDSGEGGVEGEASRESPLNDRTDLNVVALAERLFGRRNVRFVPVTYFLNR